MTTILALPVLETPTLCLREMRSQDVGGLAGFMTQSRYQRHIAHRLKDHDEVAEFVRRQVAVQCEPRRHVYHLAAEHKTYSVVIGEGFIISHASRIHELGWGVHPDHWSRGLGTEIGRGLLAIGFEHLGANSLWCKVMRDNAASAAVAKHIGMSCTKSENEYPIGQGKVGPVDFYAMTAEEYFDLPY
jgi:[ribosomal protein S5]-alanine N-acetyltransferase